MLIFKFVKQILINSLQIIIFVGEGVRFNSISFLSIILIFRTVRGSVYLKYVNRKKK